MAFAAADRAVGDKGAIFKLTSVGEKTFANDALERSDTQSTAPSTSDGETDGMTGETEGMTGSEYVDDDEEVPVSATDTLTRIWGLAGDMAATCTGHSVMVPSMTSSAGNVPVICGHMYKKSPQKCRFTAWDQRFFVVASMKMFWWKDEKSCALDVLGSEHATIAEIESRFLEAEFIPQCRGMINLAMSEPRIVTLWSEQTKFRLIAPADGWPEGATTDKHHDAKRDYEFDAEGSAYGRSEWVEIIRKHIEFAQQRERVGSEARSEYWQDETVDEAARKLSRIFLMRSLAK